jgi:gliding motility-associated-like protein
LSAGAGPGPASGHQWQPASMLSCTDCPNPFFFAGASDTTVKLIAQSRYGCSDSAFALMSVPPADDFVVNLDSAECAKGDSIRLQFEVCNLFSRGRLPGNLEVRFYDGPPAGGGKFLGPVFRISQSVSANCGVFEHRVSASSTAQIHALVNDSLPGSGAGSLFPEINVTNNSASVTYEPFRVFLEPGDTLVELNSSLSLNAGSTDGQMSTYSWMPPTNLSCTNCLNPILRVSANTELVFRGENRFGCKSGDSLKISVFLEGPPRIPNAFTPNGDAKNDVFYVLGGKDIATIEEFSIYNRYGQKIFQRQNVQPNNPSGGWTGELQGKKQPAGTYVYLIRIRFRDGVLRPYQGTVTLIR